ncbi:MAG: transporter [Clostridia bacterium]|nr:transporter [Clostridia bacterium]
MRKSVATALLNLANWLEIFISFLMMFILAILSARFLVETITPQNMMAENALSVFLEHALNIAVGVEFVKMLCKHTPETIIEVLLYATARQMIVYHGTPFDTLLGVICIAGLFATRKFLFCAFDSTEEVIFRATQKVKVINWLFQVKIPEEDGATLGEVLINRLTKEEQEIATGSCIYYQGVALRIAKMHGAVISRVELIRSI